MLRQLRCTRRSAQDLFDSLALFAWREWAQVFGNNRLRPMNSTVNLSFSYLEIDYVRALRAHHASRLRLRLDIVVAIGLAGIGAYLWRSPGLHWLGVGCVVVGALFAIILVAAFTI